ncbi:hypothetical protein [Hansschlegelia zhihuaiae]|uniref:Uncharacterized protein n=1 Tax=Hansschlegelia zhihuaiae TaxID=405005 RepID=A0A4Q0MML2_9HYPH|nr:hypothetical protein [Hansschlegelia zhihuaiae]RXF74715.1 hypothetical protein EK403_04835 [Hansschlegelia zhihuaiae]
MTDEPDNMVLIYLRRLDSKMDRVIDEVSDLKIGMTNLEERSAKIELEMAGINRRIDRVEGRLDRIERRLDLVDMPH